MYKRIAIIFIFNLCFYTVLSQEIKNDSQDTVTVIPEQNNRPDEEDLNNDTSLYHTGLSLSPDTINKWKNQKAFAYAKYLDSLLKDKQNKKMDPPLTSPRRGWLDNLLSASGTKIFFWILAVGFILFILYKLFLTKGIFRKTVVSDNPDPNNVKEESITTESDFDAFIRQAVAGGNFRLAVRYQFLRTLYKLAEKNIIAMTADKTNYQYVKEISNPLYRNEFAALTLSYEYVWYGEFAIAENIYRKIESGFTGLNTKI